MEHTTYKQCFKEKQSLEIGQTMRMKNNMILAVCLVLLALHRTSLSRGAALSQYGKHRRPRSYASTEGTDWNNNQNNQTWLMSDVHRVMMPIRL